VKQAERDKDKAERDKDKAKRMLDEAKARLKSLVEGSNASHDEIVRADADVTGARATWTAAIEAHKTAMDAASRAVESTRDRVAVGAHLVEFSFTPDVRARLARPLSEWKAGETFDVSGVCAAIGANQWHDQLYMRSDGLALLKEWEDNAPFLAVYGTSGIGKSTLLQLAALRALVRGEPVLLHVRGSDKLVRMVDHSRLLVERLTLDDLGHKGRPIKKDTVMCYDSPDGFQVTIGHAKVFKRTFIVHSPSGNLNNTMKSDGMVTRFFPVPSEPELVAVGAIKGIDADQVHERVARFGPTFRYLSNTDESEKAIAKGIKAMVDVGVDRLVRTSNATRDVHRVTLMVPNPTSAFDEMLVFASDYIRDEVVRRMANTHASDLLRLANIVDLHGSLRCQVFESRMLDTLSRGGAKIEIATGGGGAKKVLQIAGAGVALRMENNDLALPVGETLLRHRVLYRPPHSNNASWDALFIEDDKTAYLLQMTVSDEHPVKRHDLVAGNALLKLGAFAGKVHVVFLLPPVVFERFKLPQKVLNANGKLSETADQWPQDKWHVAAVDEAPLWPR
jgi:energy-coupling factor transporter ATP-binding protein EcfA2